MPAKRTGIDASSVVTVSTDIGQKCNHCDFWIGLENFDASVNHYIEKHGYRLLHVGSQTSHAQEGGLWHSTVAVLGR